MFNKALIIIIITLIIVSLVAVFWPKNMLIGGVRGLIATGEKYYTEKYDCFGVRSKFCPPWPDYGCDLLCYGVIHNKKCFNQIYDKGSHETETECKE